MFKKFMSLLASVAVLATMTATTVSAAPAFTLTASASPSSFNPATDSTTITLTADADVQELYAYVLYPNYQLYILKNHVAMTAGTTTVTWYGRTGNTPTGAVLADGTYTVKAFAKNNNIIVGVAQASIEITSAQNPDAPAITDLKVDPISFLGNGVGSTEISFTTSDSANLTATVKKAQTGGGYTTVRTFTGYTGSSHSAGSYTIAWDGTDSDGSYVSVGAYLVEVTATNANGSDTETTTVSVGQSPQSDIIKNFSIDPSTTWDPSEENLQIDFELAEEVDSLKIEARKGTLTVEILEDENVDNDDYEEEWDGTDEDGDYVSGGSWNIFVVADGQSISLPIVIAYEEPEVSSAFVTKDSIDPTKDEFTTLVYKVDTASDVTVEVYKGTHREVTLVDEEPVSKNKWYTASFDGLDEDGAEVDEGTDWKFKITVQNSTDDDVQSTYFVSFKVDEDEVSSGKANVTNDVLAPAVYDDNASSSLELSYCLDEDADVFAAIYKGTSAGSNAKIELLDYVAQSTGCHTLSWNGKDKNNKVLDDGMYTYKVISRTTGSKKDNETGKFVIGNAGTTTVTPPPVGGDYSCAMYVDMFNADGTELCDAAGWVTARGIFHGYPNGSFMPYQNITRAEVLKVVLEAFEAVLLPANGSSLGFSDLNPYAWYITYLRTAQFYGLLEGYEDGTAKPEKNITRVEALKFVLEASEIFTGQLLTGGVASYADVDYTKWYAQYVGAAYTYQLFDANYYGSQAYLHPSQLAQRGEIALMLYRLNKAGFIK